MDRTQGGARYPVSIREWLAGLVADVRIVAGTAVIGNVAIDQSVPGDTNGVELAAPSELHIGNVTGQAKSIQVPLTVTNGAYTIGDSIGGLVTFANAVRVVGGHSLINSIKLGGVTAIGVDVQFFNANLATPVLDNGVLNWAAADVAKWLGTRQIATSDWLLAANAFGGGTLNAQGLQVKAATGSTTIYAYLKALATTSPGTTAMTLTVDFEYQD